MADEDLSFLEESERANAQNRAFSQHDTLSFGGTRLRPMSAGTLSLLMQSGNQLVHGSNEAPIADAAGFILLHQLDEDAHRKARAAVWSGGWDDYVFKFLDTLDLKELLTFIPQMSAMVKDYMAILTKPNGGQVVQKKTGLPTTSRPSSRKRRR